MSSPESVVVESRQDERPCPICGSMTEPELDGDHLYYECWAPGCEGGGYAFGHRKVDSGVSIGDCERGIPESVRRAASAPMEAALAQEAKSQPVLLGLPSIPRRSDPR